MQKTLENHQIYHQQMMQKPWKIVKKSMSKIDAEKNGKMHQPSRQNGIQNEPKIDIWAHRARFFEILGGFLRGPIFHKFLIGKNRSKIRKSPAFWAQEGAWTRKMVRPGGMSGAAGEVRRG